MAENFVKSAVAILFHLSSKEICVLHLSERNGYVLAKGRRNCGETRRAAALREIAQETGFPCRLLALDMSVRCPPSVETKQLDDRARFFTKKCEPLALQIRQVADGEVKLIWWYVAAINEDESMVNEVQVEDKFAVELLSYADALDKLTFQMDRDMLQKAIGLVTNTYLA